jgi:hypothetical protein
MKIGAVSELPNDDKLAEVYLNDFWNDLFYKNPLVPLDIPFDIIIDSFTFDVVQGKIERKGNNQAAIIQCFNGWIRSDTTRNNLYAIRNAKYPTRNKILKAENKKKELKDYTDTELKEEYLKALSIKEKIDLDFIDVWINKIKYEMNER